MQTVLPASLHPQVSRRMNNDSTGPDGLDDFALFALHFMLHNQCQSVVLSRTASVSQDGFSLPTP